MTAAEPPPLTKATLLKFIDDYIAKMDGKPPDDMTTMEKLIFFNKIVGVLELQTEIIKHF